MAHKFFTEGDVIEYPALAPLMTRVTNGSTDVQPVPVYQGCHQMQVIRQMIVGQHINHWLHTNLRQEFRVLILTLTAY